jgi:invasion protein IalB
MSAFKRSVPLALAGAAVAVAAGLAAGPAQATQQAPAGPGALDQHSVPAASGWTVSHGGRAVAVAVNAVVRDTTAGQTAPCHLSTVQLSLKSGKKLAGSDAGSVTSAGFGECTLPKGIPLKVTLAGFPWHVNLKSYNAAKGLTTGTLTGLHVGISIAVKIDGLTFSCSALADGSGADAHTGALAATYSNKTGVLTAEAAGGHLRLYDVKNCNGLIKDGDNITLSASYKVSPTQKITGP